AVSDAAGAGVPFLAEGVARHPDGSLAEVTITFRADGVPALGYRTYWVTEAPGPGAEGWAAVSPVAVANSAAPPAAGPSPPLPSPAPPPTAAPPPAPPPPAR